MSREITEGEQALIDWQIYRGDDFNSLLAQLIAKSDSDNRTKLARGFPDHVSAVSKFQNVDGYWEDVLERYGILDKEKYIERERCPFCGFEDEVGRFTYLKAGFNGIKKGDPEDLGKLECPRCGERFK